MGEPWLSSILSGPGARRPGGSGSAGHRGRSTVRHAVDRPPLQCMHRRRSPRAAAPVTAQLWSPISTSLTDVIFLLR